MLAFNCAGADQPFRSVSGDDRSHQRLGPDDVPNPCQIIGQDRECHFSGYFWSDSHEVRRPHAGLHRAERQTANPTKLNISRAGTTFLVS